jgi:hypothetical protein
VLVEGSRVHAAGQHTIKLEGARINRTRDDVVHCDQANAHPRGHDNCAALLRRTFRQRVEQTFGLSEDQCAFDVRLYGHNEFLGNIDPARSAPREVRVMLWSTYRAKPPLWLSQRSPIR